MRDFTLENVAFEGEMRYNCSNRIKRNDAGVPPPRAASKHNSRERTAMSDNDSTTLERLAYALEKIEDAPFVILSKVTYSTRFIQAFGILSLLMLALMFHIAASAFERGSWTTAAMFGVYALFWSMPARDMPAILQERKQEAAISELRLKANQRITPFTCLEKDTVRQYPRGHYVYIIQDVDISGYCKIGRTNSLANRLGRFEVVMPFRWNVVHVIPAKDDIGTEAFLHRHFAQKRVAGEWFALEANDVELLRTIVEA